MAGHAVPAQGAVEVDRHVADLSGGPVKADERPSIDDDAAPEAGRDGDVDRRAGADRRPEAPFGHHSDVRIPLQKGGQVQRILHALYQGYVAPACQVRR